MLRFGLVFLVGWSTFLAQSQERGMVPSAPVQAQRIALVIGNGAYSDAPLMNPPNDARDMANALRELGFAVVHKENATQREMKELIRQFGNRLTRNGVGLFYFAGHGVQVRGENYLVPVGAAIGKEEEVEYESVNVGLVLAQMENAQGAVNIVLLDACRNNPFARSFRSSNKGLAYLNAPQGTIIAYATAPGSVAVDGKGKNGVYTGELLKQIRVPGLKIEDVFKRVRASVQSKTGGAQVAWEASSLMGDFYFNPTGVVVSPPAADVPAASTTGPTGEIAVREHGNTENQNIRYDGLYQANVGEYSSYLRFYGDGTVIGTSSTGTPTDLAKWFHRPYEDTGRFVIEGSRVRFSLTSPTGTVDYQGSLIDGLLTLDTYSHINGHKDKHEYRFTK